MTPVIPTVPVRRHTSSATTLSETDDNVEAVSGAALAGIQGVVVPGCSCRMYATRSAEHAIAGF